MSSIWILWRLWRSYVAHLYILNVHNKRSNKNILPFEIWTLPILQEAKAFPLFVENLFSLKIWIFKIGVVWNENSHRNKVCQEETWKFSKPSKSELNRSLCFTWLSTVLFFKVVREVWNWFNIKILTFWQGNWHELNSCYLFKS